MQDALNQVEAELRTEFDAFMLRVRGHVDGLLASAKQERDKGLAEVAAKRAELQAEITQEINQAMAAGTLRRWCDRVLIQRRFGDAESLRATVSKAQKRVLLYIHPDKWAHPQMAEVTKAVISEFQVLLGMAELHRRTPYPRQGEVPAADAAWQQRMADADRRVYVGRDGFENLTFKRTHLSADLPLLQRGDRRAV